jgi:hypothetical protein
MVTDPVPQGKAGSRMAGGRFLQCTASRENKREWRNFLLEWSYLAS